MILIVSCMMVDCHNGNHNYLSSASTIQLDSSWARKMPRSSSASEWAPISILRAAGTWKKVVRGQTTETDLLCPCETAARNPAAANTRHLDTLALNTSLSPFPSRLLNFSSFPIPLIFERVGWSLVRCHFIVLLFVTRNEWEIVLGFYLTGKETRTGSSV